MKKTQNINQKIVIAMSGGVDSSVAAALLNKKGFDVIGVFLKFWKDPKCSSAENNICSNQEALLSVRSVASKLKIPLHVLDASKEFKAKVVDYYIDEYDYGRTPNPCVECNKFIKFGWLLKKAEKLGAEFIATGHYARIRCSFASSQKDVRSIEASRLVAGLSMRLRPTFCDSAQSHLSLYRAKDKNKDQSYFLWQLTQNQLKHILFPIGNYTKPEVRKLAHKFGLPSAEKKESQDICFIPNSSNSAFLSRYAAKLTRPGNIVDFNGNILGRHRGLAYYTIGQRSGLKGVQLKFQSSKLNARNSGFQPAYVVKLNVEKNELVVGAEKDLYQKELIVENLNWINTLRAYGLGLTAKIRYGHNPANGKLQKIKNDKIKFIFNKPQRAITPGQSVVFYKGEELIGGGIIEKVNS